MEQLEAVNIMLATIRFSRVESLSVNETKKDMAIDALAEKRKDILVQGFDFNTNKVDLPVNTGDRVELDDASIAPAPWIKIALPSSVRCKLNYRYEGGTRYLWDMDENDWYAQAVTGARVTFDITDFSQIPELFALWITHEAAADFYGTQYENSMPPAWVLQRKLRSHAKAMNNECNTSIDNATGWNQLRRVGTATGTNPGSSQVIYL